MLYPFFVAQVLADPEEGDPPELELLEFLAEVSQATGEGFNAWLEAETEADYEKGNATKTVGE